eukprot:gene11107-18724_t
MQDRAAIPSKQRARLTMIWGPYSSSVHTRLSIGTRDYPLPARRAAGHANYTCRETSIGHARRAACTLDSHVHIATMSGTRNSILHARSQQHYHRDPKLSAGGQRETSKRATLDEQLAHATSSGHRASRASREQQRAREGAAAGNARTASGTRDDSGHSNERGTGPRGRARDEQLATEASKLAPKTIICWPLDRASGR